MPKPKHKGPPYVYPWDTWLQKGQWKLREGKEIKSSIAAFKVHIYRKAAQEGLVLSLISVGPRQWLLSNKGRR